MTESTPVSEVHQLRGLAGGYFRLAAAGGWVVFGLQLAALLLGAIPSIRDRAAAYAPVILAGLAYSLAVVRLLSDSAKTSGDRILRLLEFHDGLGRLVRPREAADVQDDASALVRLVAPRATLNESYYASRLPQGPARAIANTYESAWWTQRLARDMVNLERFQFSLILLVALLVLRAATLGAIGNPVPEGVVQLASALILFLLTQGPLKRIIDFAKLSSGAKDIVEACERYSSGETHVSRADAIELMTRYQFIRKGSPLIPSLLWKLRRRRLNTLWNSVEASAAFRSAD